MKKHAIKQLGVIGIIGILIHLTGCEESGTEIATASTESDLPTCDTDKKGQVIYIEATKDISACTGTEWTSVKGKDGANGADGLTILSNRSISATTSDYCTEFTGELCYFNGGQIIKFSDSSIFFTGTFTFFYEDSGDTDTEVFSATNWLPSSAAAGYIRLSPFVARGNGINRLFLYYERETDSAKLIYDSNGNGSIDSSDAKLESLTITTH